MNKKETKEIQPKENYIWHFFDANNKVLGRLATEVAKIVIGKTDLDYAPNKISRNKVVITNAGKISVTGKKLKDKIYHWHTEYPKGIRQINLEDMMKKDPTEALHKAIKGMLPDNKLKKFRIRNVFIYEGDTHPHTAQSNAKNK